MKKILFFLSALLCASTAFATVNVTTTRMQYDCNGTSTNYAYSFKVYADDELQVVKKSSTDVESTLVLNTNYTVTGAGTSGGNVVLSTAATCASGETLTIIRAMDLVQETDYEDGGGLSAETIEADFDKARMVDQQLQEKITRAIKLNISTELGEIDLPPPGENKLIGWNSAGTDLVTYDSSRGISPGEIASTIDDLRQITGTTTGDSVVVLGYYAAGDGGGGPIRIWSASSTATDNGGSVIKPTAIDVSAPGRWLWEHSGPVYITWFGAKESNTEAANTTILHLVRDYLDGLGGGRMLVPDGDFPIADFTFGSAQNVIIQGISQGSSYGNFKTNSILSTVTGTFAIRFPVTSAYCGLQDLAVQSDGTTNTVSPFLNNDPGAEYGLFIETGSTTIKGVTVAGFQYGAVGAQGLNSNLFEDVAFVWNTRAGWTVTPGTSAGYALHHPNISVPASYTSNTVYTMRNCTMRRNAWGIILRAGTIRAYDVLTESNVFGGLLEWGDNVGAGDWYNSYFEANWQAFSPSAITWATSSLDDNNMLLESAGVTIALVDNASNALSDFGYQITIGGPTAGTNTGPGYGNFYSPTFVQSSSQKSIFIKQGLRIKFLNGSSTSGDQTNACRFSYATGGFLANRVHFTDYNGTLPASLGNRGAKFASDGSLGGGMYATIGGFGGTHYAFPATQVASTDPNTLDDYEEGVYSIVISTASGANFDAVTYGGSSGGRYVKIGRHVHIQGKFRSDSITLGGATGGLVVNFSLPFAAAANTGPSDGDSVVNISRPSGFATWQPISGHIIANSSTMQLEYRTAVDGSETTVTVANLATGAGGNIFSFSADYIAAQ